jgi:serine protease
MPIRAPRSRARWLPRLRRAIAVTVSISAVALLAITSVGTSDASRHALDAELTSPDPVTAAQPGTAGSSLDGGLDGASPAGFVDGQLIVKFQPDVSRNEQAAAVSSVGAARIARRLLQDRYVVTTVPVGAEDQYADMLSNHPAVESAEKDVIRVLDTHTNPTLPNDQFFSYQWHMQTIQAEQAWDSTTGSGTTVAIVDSGVAYTYLDGTTTGGTVYEQAPDFAGTSFVAPYDAFNGDAEPEDDDGHGTHVAGTVAQKTNNTIGVAGVAQGVVVVAAAGNGGSDGIGDPAIEYPGALPTVISTGAVRFDLTRTGYSNYGTAEGGASHLHLVAPGGDVLDQNGDTFIDGVLQNTYWHTCASEPDEDYTAFAYCFYLGTSMASPHVAGVAALMKSANPSITPSQVRDTLRCSSLDLGAAGYDSEYGAGLVQAFAAIQDTDGDGTVDACDVDDDNDLAYDVDETGCGSNPLDPAKIPERVDGLFAGQDDDGDTLVDEALPAGAENFDCDGDGYIGASEDHVYSYLPQTNGDQKSCQEYDLSHPNPNLDIKPSLRWPSDVNKSQAPLDSLNRINVQDLTSFLAPVPYVGTNVGTNPGDIRFDLLPGPGIFATDINIQDLTALIAPAAPTGAPSMLGGVRAMGGPPCPWAP